VIKETNATTGNITDYLYGDDLIKQSRAANDSYYLYDGLGSTRALTDATGSLTNSYDYESFGSVLNQTGSTENNYLFTGEQFDTSLDNYYLRARYYDQNVGRFTQQDSWMGDNQDPVTLNKYLYANADSVNNIDPSGHMSIIQQMSALAGAGILIGTAQQAGQSLVDFSWDTDDGFEANNRVGDSLYATIAFMKVKGDINRKANELALPASIALAGSNGSWQAHHTVPIYTCGAVDQSPNMVPLRSSFHMALHANLRIYAEFIDKIYGAAFDSKKSVFDYTSGANRSGLKNLAQTSVGRSYIANHLDAFYSTGWYAGNINFKPRFQAEKNLFINSASRNSLPGCQR
jgi:RHS repeat-associated protein